MSVFTRKFLRFNAAGQGSILLSADTINTLYTNNDWMSNLVGAVGYQNWQNFIYYDSPSVASGASTSVVTNKLVDSSATFITDGVSVGDIVSNLPSGFSYETVVSVDSETELTLTGDIFTAANEAYNIYTPEYKLEETLLDSIQKAVSTKWREAIIDVEVPEGITIGWISNN